MDQPASEENPSARNPPPPPRRRQPVFNLPRVVLALIAMCAGVHAVRSYALDQLQDLELLVRFAFIPLRYSGEYAIDLYAWVSPITYSFLHGDVVHLAVNMIWLAAFGSPIANRIGIWRFCLFWAATVLAAVGFHYVLHPLDATPLVGASGAVSGMMGAASRFGFRIDRSANRASFDGPVLPMSHVFTYRTTVSFLAVWMVVNLAMGLGLGGPGMESSIAWEAHIGGFLAGFLGMRLFDRPRDSKSWRNSS